MVRTTAAARTVPVPVRVCGDLTGRRLAHCRYAGCRQGPIVWCKNQGGVSLKRVRRTHRDENNRLVSKIRPVVFPVVAGAESEFPGVQVHHDGQQVGTAFTHVTLALQHFRHGRRGRRVDLRSQPPIPGFRHYI